MMATTLANRYEALTGSRSIEAIGHDAATIEAFIDEPLDIEHVEVLIVTYEIAAASRYELLAPALNPTNPSVVSWAFYKVKDSPLGPFNMGVARLACRAGLRARNYVLSGFVNSPEAQRALRERQGYPLELARVELDFGHAAASATVVIDDTTVFAATARNPVLLHEEDLYWPAEMVPAHTPEGLVLLQCDATFDAHHVERLQPTITTLVTSAWSDPAFDLGHVICATRISGGVTFPPIRFVCDLERSPEVGTTARF
jgi:Acetoacetate decarboxylase (ADC)